MENFQYQHFDFTNKHQIQLFSDIWFNPETRKYFPGFVDTKIAFERYLQVMENKQNIDRRDYFTIYQNHYIGWLNITGHHSLKMSVELMYALHPHFRGRNLGNDMIRFFLEELKKSTLQHVEAYVDIENKASQKILTYNHFQQAYEDDVTFYFWKTLK